MEMRTSGGSHLTAQMWKRNVSTLYEPPCRCANRVIHQTQKREDECELDVTYLGESLVVNQLVGTFLPKNQGLSTRPIKKRHLHAALLCRHTSHLPF